ncbi:MAG: hypothetical protein F6J94_17960 [Moorea sp. SIO1F2]|uniref:hypothetical protein n=1 Tax=unclassified Moorena TaxID=2683338 RepID=UPI0013B5F86A|nr:MULTISPECIES: hypothetical protein [unclassified Moorena]NEO22435.1 hypothetical protein [Moorena sp. SIO4A5]NEQ59342.1 hypothetical protein [Moorena sp. SIO4A1]NET83734.1 hypothetical protein [Moorena sp. SIO1F2]
MELSPISLGNKPRCWNDGLKRGFLSDNHIETPDIFIITNKAHIVKIFLALFNNI